MDIHHTTELYSNFLSDQTIPGTLCFFWALLLYKVIDRQTQAISCPSADEWIRKLWYIYTMEYYSAIKKNSFESVLMRWMKLEPIIQSEVSQKDQDQYSILTHVYEFKKMVMITLYAKQKKRHRCTEQTFGLCGRRRGCYVLREQH